MKIINSFVVLMILVCESQLSHEEELNCLFGVKGYYGVGSLYSCVVTSLDNPHNNLTIDAYSGEHKANKNEADVKGIRIFNTNSKYIPTNLGSLLNLIALHMERIQLVEIKAKDFHGMQDLESITFYENKLKSVPLDAFATLKKLRFIDLGSNQIEELPNGIFAKNLKIERIHLYGNKIKYLGTEIFNDLQKLHFVYLGKNICVNKEYRGTKEINQLKDDIKMKCKNPNEVPATTTTTTTQTPTTTTTTQNPMEKLKCEFKDKYYAGDTLYSCVVTSLVNPHHNLMIEGYSGEHKANKNDADVKGIYIHDTNTKYIPTNLGYFPHLIALRIQSTQLVEIKTEDFHGMRDLKIIGFYSNKLSSIPLDVFATLTKLRIIDLRKNQIEELPNGIFKNNLELEDIHLQHNKIKYLGTEMFNGLKKLNSVELSFNICINKDYRGASKINQMKDDIKLNCKNPSEVPATITTTTTTTPRTTTTSTTQTPTTTTQFPMAEKLIEMKEQNAKLEKELREAKEQQHTNEDVLKKELREAKEQQQTNEDALKKELREAKELQQTNEDALKKELMESKELQKKNEAKATKKRDSLIMKLREAKELQKKDQIKCVAETQELIAKLSKCESMKNSFNISCKFQMTNGEYSCDARNLVIYQKQMELNEVSGTHLKSNTNENVTELKIANSSMLFWSNDIFKTFPGLQTLVIQNAQLKELSKGDFNSATNLKNLKVQENVIRVLGDDLFQGAAEHLTNIQMNSNEIVKISTGTFHGLKQLKMLSLKDNLITELQLGTFKDVVMLELLFLSGNKIKFLNGKLFEFNVKLMTLAVDHNELREIGEDILNYSVALKDVDFNGNDCIYQEFKGSEVDELKFNIKHCCKNPEQALNVYNCGHRGWD